ncbi:unnamed protein product, partial [Ceratitis capitata]
TKAQTVLTSSLTRITDCAHMHMCEDVYVCDEAERASDRHWFYVHLKVVNNLLKM